MTDITMCANVACPMAGECHRSEASGTTPNGRYQSWSHFKPDFDACDHFWPSEGTAAAPAEARSEQVEGGE